MREFSGRVAVVTGAASGIGRALVGQCVAEGMSVVLADIEQAALEATAAELDWRGVSCVLQPTDVTDPAAVECLAQSVYKQFGRVDLLFNNAGVLQTGYCWEQSPQDWDRVLDVNVKGVVHGINSFVPRMLDQGGAAHIVNTGSVASLLVSPRLGPYTVSKMAVRALTETLYQELSELCPSIGVSLLCPGPVATAMVVSPEDGDGAMQTRKEIREALPGITADYMAPERCAEIVFAGVREGQFWIFTHPAFKRTLEKNTADLLAGGNPTWL